MKALLSPVINAIRVEVLTVKGIEKNAADVGFDS
jgi:hypothetical protein